MLRTKDFMMMDVVDVRGKKIGVIKDLLLNFHEGSVKGFLISSYKMFKKTTVLLKEDIISFDKKMIALKVTDEKRLPFSDIRHMDVMDENGNIMGVVEDILFERKEFDIRGLIVSSGFIRNIIYGKKILLIGNLILGEENVLYYGENGKCEFVSLPHRLLQDTKCYEKEI